MEGAKRSTLKHSTLEKINGIGAAKAKALLAAFGGIGAIKTATEAEIAKVRGVSAADARAVYKYFHEKD